MHASPTQPDRRCRAIAGALGLAAALIAAGASAQPVSGTDPRINDMFLNADAVAERQRFEGESREIFHLRERIVAATAPASGATVADVGAGTGFFSMLFARAVGPAGRVLAVDISKPFVAGIAERAKQEGLANVTAILGTDRDAALPEAGVDLVFTSDTYHHFVEPAPVLASIRRALRPGGRFIVIDYERIPGVSSPGRLQHVRAGKEAVIREVEAAGFRLSREVTGLGLRENYYLEFTRP